MNFLKDIAFSEADLVAASTLMSFEGHPPANLKKYQKNYALRFLCRIMENRSSNFLRYSFKNQMIFTKDIAFGVADPLHLLL